MRPQKGGQYIPRETFTDYVKERGSFSCALRAIMLF